MTSTIYLLCGLPGSGKTSYARKLEKAGATRLTLDEDLFSLYGKGFPLAKYQEYETEIKNLHLQKLKEEVLKKHSVCLDWGFWKRNERDTIKKYIESLHAKWVLLYFKKNIEDLKNNIRTRTLDTNHDITEEMLDRFQGEFEEPVNESEQFPLGAGVKAGFNTYIF